jgi:hypothetical protein
VKVATGNTLAGHFISAIVSDDTNVYWTEFGDDSVRTTPIDAANACDSTMGTCKRLDAMTGYYPAAIAQDDQAIYWVDQIGDMTNTYNSGLVLKVAK